MKCSEFDFKGHYMKPINIYEKITDQPGRVLAVFVFGPIILWKGMHTYKYDWFLIIFAILLILWDLWWLCQKPPKEANV